MLIQNGTVVDPVTGLDGQWDIRIQGSVITQIGTGLDAREGEETVDAAGLTVAPGLIDTHVHFRDPGQTYKEDIFTGAAAAAKGGFTTVLCMANTNPVIDTPELLAANLEKGRQTGIHVLQAAAITKGLKGKELTDLRALAAAGARSFTDDGIPLMDEKLLLEAMELAKELEIPVSLHEEDPAFIASPGVHMGRVSCALGLGGASALAEEVMTARDCALALASGADVVIQHISSSRSVGIVRAAKEMGAHVHAEATPHHFTLTEKAVLEHGTLARMNPPLRTEKDRAEIQRGLADGTIDIIATDHAPHSAEEKARPFAEAPSGITGLETSLALGITTLVRGGVLTLRELLTKMIRNPAKLYRLDVRGIAVGAAADLVVFAPDETFTVGAFASKATNSPFAGQTLYGPVMATICGGKFVYKKNGESI